MRPPLRGAARTDSPAARGGRRAARRRFLRAACLLGALGCAAVALLSATAAGQGGGGPGGGPPTSAAALAARGRILYVAGCSNCHGFDADGTATQGPSLRGVGMAAADFYLSTGRMPLDNPTDEPFRTKPAYNPRDIAAIVAYIGTFGGPGIPHVDPAAGALNRGQTAFTENCAGCHTVLGRGGVVTGAAVPALTESTPTQVAEAIRVGPYVMPVFSDRQIDQGSLNDIARYVQTVVQRPDNRGGWGIGNVGPIPEGMVAWLLAGALLVAVSRMIGERS